VARLLKGELLQSLCKTAPARIANFFFLALELSLYNRGKISRLIWRSARVYDESDNVPSVEKVG
jgi:hypothetical protein